jgi:hypothetical protein
MHSMERPGTIMRWTVARLALGAAVVALMMMIRSGPPARADDYCDTSEAVACIPMPDGSGSATAAPSGPNPAAASNAPQIAAVPVPCAPSCCFNGAASSGSGTDTSAAAAVPVPICSPGGGCNPPPLGISIPAPASPAVPVPVPQPVFCSPYRGIYATINLGNGADVRALRTLSTQGLRQYWRQSALQQIANQVSQLQLSGAYATARLYSIQVLDSNIDFVGGTATVHTMEHWLYQQNSSLDGSIVLSQDEWVANEYDLSRSGNSWYITGNTTALQPGPVPVPATGG